MADEAFSDEQLDRAIEALSDPERFREAETRVARAAPQLQRVLNEALHAGGWFGEAHESQVRKAARRRGGGPHPARRGDPDGDARRGGRGLGAGAASCDAQGDSDSRSIPILETST